MGEVVIILKGHKSSRRKIIVEKSSCILQLIAMTQTILVSLLLFNWQYFWNDCDIGTEISY